MGSTTLIPTDFNEDVLQQLKDVEQLIYFKWDFLTDNLVFRDPVQNVPFAFTQHIEHASTALWNGHLVHPDDAVQLGLYLDSLFSDFSASQTGPKNGKQRATTKLRILSRRQNGDSPEHLWAELRLLVYYENDLPRVAYGYFRNIHAQQQLQMKLQHKAEHDLLTGLLNKAATHKYVEDYLASLTPSDAPPALLIIDADGFKAINDTFGHMFGDAVLTDMSMAITKAFRQTDIIGRIGGDEFLVLFKELPQLQLLELRCKELGNTLRHVYKSEGKDLPFSVSIGIALYPDHGKTAQELFEHADRALYEAKARGRDQYFVYHSSLFGAASVISNRDPQNMAEIQQRAFKDNMIEFIFKLLYETSSPDATITLSIGMFGKQYNLDRVAIDRYNKASNQYTTAFEWLSPNGVSLRPGTFAEDMSDIVNQRNQMILSRYHPSSYGVISLCRDTRKAGEEYQEAATQLHVGAFAHIRITHGDEDLGCVCFESASAPRTFTEKELRDLNIFSVLLGNILLAHESDEELLQDNNHLREILDHMQEFIYVVNKETYEPVYFNQTIRQALGGISVNQPCYKRFHSLSSPCPFCPAQQLSKSGNEYLQMSMSTWGTPTDARIYNIEWEKGSGSKYALIIQDPF